jgi:hypothetical protein
MPQAEPQELPQKVDRRGQNNAGRAWGTPMRGVQSHLHAKAAKEVRIVGLLDEWTASIGGPTSLTAAERDLLRKAAELTTLRVTRAEDGVRIVNAVSKVLAQCGLVNRRDKRHKPEQSFAEALEAHKRMRAAEEPEAEVEAEVEAKP